MIGRVRESRNPKKVIRVTLMESYGEIGRVPVNLSEIHLAHRSHEIHYFSRINRITYQFQDRKNNKEAVYKSPENLSRETMPQLFCIYFYHF